MEAQVMGFGTVEVQGDVIVKTYPLEFRSRWACEVAAYQLMPWATPRLLGVGECSLTVERLLPVTAVGPTETVHHAPALRSLLGRLHENGWWHCDVAAENVVIDPERGPLLIDWENIRPSAGELSYDLHGALAAGVTVEFEPHRPDGVWWNSAFGIGRYWGV